MRLNRLIPAYAGKTIDIDTRDFRAPAHPRVCGENQGDTAGGVRVTGSSPRMRGKPAIPVDLCVILWLIPAYAGKTRIWRSAAWKTTAHPRVCGENLAKYTPGRRSAGSSPRMRGKLIHATSARRNPGLIPAYAGKTAWQPRLQAQRPAHPRVCGENRRTLYIRHTATGSSPRMRGKLPCADL